MSEILSVVAIAIAAMALWTAVFAWRESRLFGQVQIREMRFLRERIKKLEADA